MRVLGRFALAAGTGVLVLVLGVLTAFVLGTVVLPEGSASGRAPGDGFLILAFNAIGVLVFVPVSIAAASWVLLRSGGRSKALPQNQSGFF